MQRSVRSRDRGETLLRKRLIWKLSRQPTLESREEELLENGKQQDAETSLSAS